MRGVGKKEEKRRKKLREESEDLRGALLSVTVTGAGGGGTGGASGGGGELKSLDDYLVKFEEGGETVLKTDAELNVVEREVRMDKIAPNFDFMKELQEMDGD